MITNLLALSACAQAHFEFSLLKDLPSMHGGKG